MAETGAKKILFIVQLPPPIHGASLANKLVVESPLVNSSFTIDVINLQFAKSLDKIKKFSFSKFFKSFIYAFQIFKKIIIFKPDLIYFTLSSEGFAFYRDAFYVFIFKLFKNKIVYNLHSKGFKKNTENSVIKRKIGLFIFKNNYVICVGERLIADIDNLYSGKPFIIPCGIKKTAPFERFVKEQNGAPIKILYLSNYTPGKGILVLINALELLKEKNYSFKADLAGAPIDLSITTLKSVVENKGLENYVNITGPLYGDDKIQAYKEADIFVFPTYNETFGIVNLEAMQFSLPVVSTFEGSIPDVVVDNVTGLLAKQEDHVMLAEKIAVLLDNPELGIEMGKKGAARFNEYFTLDHFEKNVNNTLHSILST